MSFYHHLAHLNEIHRSIKIGAKIKRGYPIGTVGKTGTQYCHLHYEVFRGKPDRWTQYVYDSTGKPFTEEQFDARYIDPMKWIDRKAKIPAPYTTFGGWEFKDKINRLGALHGGIDINDGYGDQDLGNPVISPCDGEVVYVGRLDGGWGNHVWIAEDSANEYPTVDIAFAKSVAGRIFLAVQEKGEAYYVDQNGIAHYMGATGEDMLAFVRKMAVGISTADLNKLPKG